MADETKENILPSVVAEICAASDGLARRRSLPCQYVLPSRDTLIETIELLRSVLFPGYFGTAEVDDQSVCFHVGATLDRVLRTLKEQVKRGVCFTCDRKEPDCTQCEENARVTTRKFLARLPEVRRLLATDVAITSYRLAHELFRLEVPLLPRIIAEHAHSITGIDIHPGASIDEFFFIDHGTGVVIGETSLIGKRVRIYQGVTLGAKSFPLDADGNPVKGIPRHPIVEDDVIIYGAATILGRVTIGRGSTIGGNVWLTDSVPPGSRVTQARARQECFEAGAGI
jgi:serine O-acetyltransferase